MAGIDQNQLTHIQALLRSAATGQGNHKAALEELASMKPVPDFWRYCAYIFGNPEFHVQERQLAALQIKNGVKNPACNSVMEVRQATMAALGDSHKLVRNVACSIVSTALSQSMWDPRATVNEVIQGLNSGEEHAVHGCLNAIADIVDENIEVLDFHGDGSPALTPQIAEAILPFLGHTDLHVQKHALGTVTVLMEQAAMRREGATYDYMGSQVGAMLQYVGGILTNPEAPAGYLKLCSQTLYYTLAYADFVAGHVPSMVDLMVGLAAHSSEEVRIEVVQFFKTLVESQMLRHVDQSMVPNILRYVLDCLVYSQAELGMLTSSQGDAGQPDKPEDIRPKNFNLRTRRAGDDDDDDEDDEEVDQWNLRKAAGGCLLTYVEALGDAILEHILNDVASRLDAQDWLQQESAIMALGIMAGGCEGLRQYLASIIDRLLGMLEGQQTHFLVRGMCLWAIEQNAEYILTSDESKNSGFLPRVINAIIAAMTADTKIIQTRALTALDSYAETSEEEELVPYVTQILSTMSQCFNGYQLKNLYQLFETANTVYGCFGRRLAEDDTINIMMEPLMGMWGTVGNDSPLIFPFFMAMAAACSALGAAMESMASDIFTRSCGMVEFHMAARMQAVQAQEDAPDQSDEFLVAGLDLLSGICEALASGVEPYITQQVGAEKMTQLLQNCATDTSPEVRQTVFGVMGELCGGCVGYVQAYWGTFAPLLANALSETDNYTVASNAAWSLSEFFANYVDDGNTLQTAHIDGYYGLLAHLLVVEHDNDMRAMRENAAIAIGRLVALDPSVVSRAQAEPYFGGFCTAMAPMQNGANKEAALRGLVGIWGANPGGLANDAQAFADMLGGLPQNLPQDLKAELKTLVAALKQGLGASWSQMIGSMAGTLQQKLTRNFGC